MKPIVRLFWFLSVLLLNSTSYAVTFIDAKVDGVAGIDGLRGASAIAVSPDGQSVYATGFNDSALVVFRRNASDGLLTFMQSINNSTLGVNGLGGANGVVVSPDNKHVYVASYQDSALVVFNRNAADGTLSLVEIQQNGVSNNSGLSGANAIAFSPDNLRVYVTGAVDDALNAYSRDPQTGALTLLAMHKDGLNNVDGLDGPTGVTVSSDGYVYVTSPLDNSVAVFSRSPSVGELAFIAVYKNNLGGVTGLRGAYGLSLSPDNNALYVASNTDNAITAFQRVTGGGLSFLASYANNTSGISGLNGVRAVAITASGNQVYAASTSDSALVVFNRDVNTHALTFDSVLRNGSQNITSLSGATAVAISPDDAHVYTAALLSHAVTTFSVVSADLSLTMTEYPLVAINTNLSYTLTATNNGPSQATNVIVTDNLPNSVTNVIATASQGSCEHDTTTNVITCQLGTLDVNANAKITLNMTTPSSVGNGTLTNKATVSSGQPDGNAANNTVTQNTTLKASVPTADVQVTIANVADPVGINNNLTYIITTTNNGPDAASNVKATHTLPISMTFVSTNDSQCSYQTSTHTVVCNYTSGSKGTISTTHIVVNTPATASTDAMILNSTLSADEFDPNHANNAASVTTHVNELNFDLAVTDAYANPNSVSVGTYFFYHVTAANQSDTSASNSVLTATLPTQVKYISDTGKCSYALSKLNCDLGTLDALGNPSTTVNIKAQAIQAVNNASATFTVTGNGTDVVSANNSGIANLTITGEMADIVVTVESSDNPAVLDKAFSYTIRVVNNGPNIASVQLVGTLDKAANAIIENPCGTATKIECILDPLESGTEKTIEIKVTPTELGTITLTVEASSVGEYFDPTFPNTATRSVTVSNAIADLKVELITDPAVPFIGKTFSYTITVTNEGPSDATSVVLTHTLPTTDMTFISAESSQGAACTQNENVITCPIGTMTAKGTATLVTKVTPTAIGTFNVATSANSIIFDPVQSNNTIETTTSVSEYSTDLELTITDDPNPVLVSNPLTYTITVKNKGPDAATGILLTDTLPLNSTFLSATVEPAGSCINPPLEKEGTGGVVTCSIEDLALNKTATVTFIIQPDVAGTVTNTVQIQSLESDPNSDDNTVKTETRVTMPASLFFVESQKNGINGVKGLSRINDLTLSPDGLHLYAVGFNDNALVVFSRYATDGTLDFAQLLLDGSNGVDGLAAASSVAVSPDGAYVYVAAFSDNAVTLFSRNMTTGALEFKKVYKDGLEGVDGLAGAFSVAVTANHVYVAGVTDDAIAVFSRNTSSGELTFVEKIIGSDTVLLDGVSHLTISLDGTTVLATSTNSGSLNVFSRDLSTGMLTHLQALTDGVAGIEGLKSANSVIISSDGKHVYTTGGGSNSGIAIFERAQTGLLTYKTIIRNGDNGTQHLTGVFGITLTPMGNYLYAASTGDSALVVFKRDAATGLLTFTDSLTDGTGGVDGLGGARAVAIDPTGIHIYVAGFTDNGIGVLRIASADIAVSITESEDPVSVGSNLTYTVTVVNNGPDQATNVRLTDLLPQSSELISYTPSQGVCNVDGEHSLSCVLGTLNKEVKATVTVVVSPTQTTTLVNTATVLASQFDPVSPSSATVETEAAATADLTVTVATTPNPVVVASPMSYQFTITNKGPDQASNIILTQTLPNGFEFVSAQVGENKEACNFFAGKVTCGVVSLNKDVSSTMTVTATPTASGTVSSTITVTSKSFDPDAPTVINKEVVVVLNIIEGAYDNTNKTLTNYIISPTGWVKGGNVAGHITNSGLLSDVHILPDTLVTGGGELWHTITNDGTIENATLQADTTINGGVLKGQIVGNAKQPALLNGVQIAALSELSNVIIGVGSTLDSSVILKTNVQFANNANIPVGIDLTAALPYIYDAISHRSVVNLYTDILVDAKVGTVEANTLLNAINAIPDLYNNGLAFTQLTDSGVLLLVLGEEHIALVPVAITQSAQAAGVTVNPDGSVLFVTTSGRGILTEPALENPQALQTMLNNWGITEFTAYANGNIKTSQLGQYYYLARPDRSASLTDTGEGISMLTAPLTNESNLAGLHFVSITGDLRQQILYPTAAYPEELQIALAELPGAKNLQFYNNGSLSIVINEVTYTGVYDYKVATGAANGFTQFLAIPDQNADGSADIKVIYTNGDQQVIYLLPLPTIISELQVIPDIYYGGYVVSQETTGDFLFYQGSTRILLRPNYLTQLPAGTTPTVNVHPDGTVVFITNTARQLFTQPMVQEWNGLQQALQQRGFQSMTWLEDGNLRAVKNDDVSFYLRPDLTAPLASRATPTGLLELPSTVLNQPNLQLVFIDSLGTKRQQTVYPAIKEREILYRFFSQLPEVTGVRFDANGTIELTKDSTVIRGVAAYQVERTQLGTGGVQFTQITDVNGDSIADFMLVYANGDKQIVYRQ